MDTIKIRLTVDVEVKADHEQQINLLGTSNFTSLVFKKFPGADQRTAYMGAVAEGVSHIITNELRLIAPDGTYESLTLKSIAYQELEVIPPPAAVTPHVVQIGDRFKP